MNHRKTQSFRQDHANNRGYTIVELMMALSIFSIGVTGIVAMQSVTASTNGFAKNMSVATALARSWQERLAMDGTLWGGTGQWAITQTRWLQQVGTQNNTWVLPANDDNLTPTFGPRADAKGQFVTVVANTVFCTHIRLTQLIDPAIRPGSGLIRSEVRVFWPKDTDAWNGGADYCANNPASVTAIGLATSDFHFVYQTTVIRQTPGY
jgi:type IV pilus assembly protein PilV